MSDPGAGEQRRDPLCVVHLVREGSGTEPLRRFAASYRAHPADAEHDLVLLFKGFAGPAAVADHLEILGDLSAQEVFVSDEGFDLTAYLRAAERLTASRYCFLNSHSRILASGWLGHLDRALSAPGVGLVGASGSWASLLSMTLFHAGLPSAYAQVFEDRRATRRAFAELDRERSGRPVEPSGARRAAHTALALAGTLVGFERFPAHHVRTNAFIVGHAQFVAVAQAALRRKVQAHRLESGRESITRRVERLGLDAVVVDREGRVYRHEDWPASETFWQGGQSELMVADNQTDDYALGDAARRRLLSRYAWGELAAPGER